MPPATLDTTLDRLFDAAAFGLGALATAMLFKQARGAPASAALGVFFAIITSWYALNIAVFINPSWEAASLAIGLPILYLLTPAAWLYVRDITAETFQAARTDLLHALPALLALLLGLAFLGLPDAQREAFFTDAPVSPGWPLILAYAMGAARLALLAQMAAYLVLITLRLARLNKRLKNKFANLEARSLNWLKALAGLIAAGMATVLFAAFFNTPAIDDAWLSGWDFAFLLAFAFCSLQQRPVFAPAPDAVQTAPEQPASRYEKSGLTPERARQIAANVEKAMQDEQLFLNAMLSLAELAKHVGAKPDHVSETLNTIMNKSFFDLVNLYRVRAAQSLLLTTDRKITDIALDVGFNSRSSFYAAFKDVAGLSPGDFRKQGPPPLPAE